MGTRGVIILFAALAFATAAPSEAAAVSYDTAAERSFVNLINRERASRGLGTLTVKADLVAMARKHTAQMLAAGTIFHNEDLYDEVRPSRYATGENVGFGTEIGELHALFMESPTHRYNVLLGLFTEVGVGVAYDGDGWIYVTVDFARPWGSPARTTTRKAAARPAKAAPPKPVPVVERPRVVELLLRLTALDAVERSRGAPSASS